MIKTPALQRPRYVHTGAAAVYVILRKDRHHFKLGWATDPLRRAKHLEEYKLGQLDLVNSLALWLPNPTRAKEVESCMHKGLAPYHIHTGRYLDGHTEWFSCHGLTPALRMLRQMPRSIDSIRFAPVTPLTHVPQETELDDVSPQQVWWGLEDLLMRVSNFVPVRLGSGELQEISLVGFRALSMEDLGELRHPLIDLQTYAWRHSGKSGSFVSLIRYEADDLVLTLTSLRVMARWHEGAQVVSQMRQYLNALSQGRYQRWQAEPVRGNSAV
jgi:hypothetical protein